MSAVLACLERSACERCVDLLERSVCQNAVLTWLELSVFERSVDLLGVICLSKCLSLIHI